jgi:tetratricopeptide (TPR) repeat protein
MADDKEQGATGGEQINWGSEAQGHPGQSVTTAPAVSREAAPGPRGDRRPTEGSAGRGPANVLISAVLALLFGGAGAWAYERFLAQPKLDRSAEASASKSEDAETTKALARLDDRINSLSNQHKQLESRIESIPKPAPAPDLAPLEQKVARVDGLSKQFDAIPNQFEAISKVLDPLPEKIAQDERKIKELDAKLEELRKESRTLGTRPAASRNVEGSPSAASGRSTAQPTGNPSPRSEVGGLVDSALERGQSLFREGRYQEAYKAFQNSLQSDSDDARIWYYAALSYGFSTGEWRGQTEQMVQQGIALEKAGKPQKSQIDSAFTGLTKETGKEWLAFYRQRAG